MTGQAFGILFRDLRDFWEVRSVRISLTNRCAWDTVKLGDICQLRLDVIPEQEFQEGNVQLLDRISFDEGKIFSGKRTVTKMTQYRAKPKDIVVSKINARKRAIGIVPDGNDIGITIHFRALIPDTSKIDTKFLWLALRNPFCTNQFDVETGGIGKGEISEERLLNIRVPFPPIDEQRRIVATWQQAQVKATKAQERVVELEKQIFSFVGEILGRKKNDLSRPKFFALQWQEIDRWGVEIAWNTKNQRSGSYFPIRTIGELCKIGSGGTPSRERHNYFGGDILWVKTTEVRNEVIFDTEEKITELGLNNSSAKIYPAGSLIVAMYGQGATRGRTAKLGVSAATNQACAVLSEFSKDIEPDYLWYYLMSEYDNLRLQASGNNQPNLNAAMIASYPVPVPPLEVQKEIVRRVEEGRGKIRQEQETAAKVAEESAREVERMILGLSKA